MSRAGESAQRGQQAGVEKVQFGHLDQSLQIIGMLPGLQCSDQKELLENPGVFPCRNMSCAERRARNWWRQIVIMEAAN